MRGCESQSDFLCVSLKQATEPAQQQQDQRNNQQGASQGDDVMVGYKVCCCVLGSVLSVLVIFSVCVKSLADNPAHSLARYNSNITQIPFFSLSLSHRLSTSGR